MGSLGENIRALRDLRQMDQTELAKALETTSSTVSNWERGEKKDVPLSTLIRIAKVLHVTVESLILGIDTDYETMKLAASSVRQRLTELTPSLNDAQLSVLVHMAEALLRATADSRSESGTPPPNPDPPTGLSQTTPPAPHTAADVGGHGAPEPPRRTPPTAEPRRA